MQNNKKILEFFLIIIILLLPGCNWFKKETTTSPELIVINVLDKKLYDDCHIKGSINVPFEEVEQFAKKLDKNTHIVLYCSNYMCTASGAAARSLKKMGFENVWAYEAGMAEWHQNKLPVEGSCKESYLNMKIEKSDMKEDDIQPITTQDLRTKIKQMLNI